MLIVSALDGGAVIINEGHIVGVDIPQSGNGQILGRHSGGDHDVPVAEDMAFLGGICGSGDLVTIAARNRADSGTAIGIEGDGVNRRDPVCNSRHAVFAVLQQLNQSGLLLSGHGAGLNGSDHCSNSLALEGTQIVGGHIQGFEENLADGFAKLLISQQFINRLLCTGSSSIDLVVQRAGNSCHSLLGLGLLSLQLAYNIFLLGSSHALDCVDVGQDKLFSLSLVGLDPVLCDLHALLNNHGIQLFCDGFIVDGGDQAVELGIQLVGNLSNEFFFTIALDQAQNGSLLLGSQGLSALDVADDIVSGLIRIGNSPVLIQLNTGLCSDHVADLGSKLLGVDAVHDLVHTGHENSLFGPQPVGDLVGLLAALSHRVSDLLSLLGRHLAGQNSSPQEGSDLISILANTVQDLIAGDLAVGEDSDQVADLGTQVKVVLDILQSALQLLALGKGSVLCGIGGIIDKGGLGVEENTVLIVPTQEHIVQNISLGDRIGGNRLAHSDLNDLCTIEIRSIAYESDLNTGAEVIETLAHGTEGVLAQGETDIEVQLKVHANIQTAAVLAVENMLQDSADLLVALDLDTGELVGSIEELLGRNVAALIQGVGVMSLILAVQVMADRYTDLIQPVQDGSEPFLLADQIPGGQTAGAGAGLVMGVIDFAACIALVHMSVLGGGAAVVITLGVCARVVVGMGITGATRIVGCILGLGIGAGVTLSAMLMHRLSAVNAVACVVMLSLDAAILIVLRMINSTACIAFIYMGMIMFRRIQANSGIAAAAVIVLILSAGKVSFEAVRIVDVLQRRTK